MPFYKCRSAHGLAVWEFNCEASSPIEAAERCMAEMGDDAGDGQKVGSVIVTDATDGRESLVEIHVEYQYFGTLVATARRR